MLCAVPVRSGTGWGFPVCSCMAFCFNLSSVFYIAIFFEIVQPAATSADSLTQGSGAGEGVITS